MLDRIAQGHEPNKLGEELIMRSEYEIQKVKPYEEHDEKTETQVSTFISHFIIFVFNSDCRSKRRQQQQK